MKMGKSSLREAVLPKVKRETSIKPAEMDENGQNQLEGVVFVQMKICSE